MPEGAGVIVRTAAEGASEEDLARDVTRLQAQWDDIQTKANQGGAPVLLYAEPDLVIPHPGLKERRFVLDSLAELRPDILEPR